MNKPRIAIILIFLVAVSWFATASAHRYTPVPTPSIVVEGIKYRAPQNVANMGYVQAFDRTSGQKLWESKIYSVWINPFSEADVQWVFIENIHYVNGVLLVTNELGNNFRLDPKTGKVIIIARDYFAPIVLVAVPVVFLIGICFAFFLVKKFFLARVTRHYSTSQAENKIYRYFVVIGVGAAGLYSFFLCFNALSNLLQSVVEVSGTSLFETVLILEKNSYLLLFVVLWLLIVSMFSGGIYLSSLLWEFTILIKRKTKRI